MQDGKHCFQHIRCDDLIAEQSGLYLVYGVTGSVEEPEWHFIVADCVNRLIFDNGRCLEMSVEHISEIFSVKFDSVYELIDRYPDRDRWEHARKKASMA
jgi:hypothetical protein